MPETNSTRRSVAAGVQRRAAVATTYDPQARTVEIVLATETPVLMPGWRIGIDQPSYYEILTCTPDACDLSQVAAGNAPLLDSHDSYSLGERLGVLNAARFENRQLIVVAAFGQSEGARGLEAEVAAGTAPPASAGYRVQELILERFDGDIPVYRATRWALREGSFTSIAADPNAGVRSDHGVSPCYIEETRAMTQNTNAGDPAPNQTREQLLAGISDEGVRAAIAAQWPATAATITPAPAQSETQQRAEQAPATTPAVVSALSAADALQLSDQARSLNVYNDQIRSMISSSTATRAAISEAILGAAAARQQGATSALPAGSAGRAGDERAPLRDGIRMALEHGLRRTSRVDDVPEGARQYMGLSLSEIAATFMGERSMPRSAADRLEVFERAFHTTSDFPNLLSGAMNTRLDENYQAATPSYRRIARQMSFADFRPHDVLRPGDFPTLQAITQAGEIKAGTFGEKKESVIVVPYGIQFGLSRQLLVNDNLGAIDQVLASQGTSVALFEEITFYAMKGTTGPTLAEVNRAVYHSSNGNLAASGSAIDVSGLGAGRAAMRKQKNLSGVAMGIGPAILLVSPDKETEAEMAMATLLAGDMAKVNPFSNRLQIVVGGQLTGNAWELYADPAQGANWTWGLLDGFTAPRLRVENVFGQQGAKVSLEHDFGCGAIDYRYGYRNPGA